MRMYLARLVPSRATLAQLSALGLAWIVIVATVVTILPPSPRASLVAPKLGLYPEICSTEQTLAISPYPSKKEVYLWDLERGGERITLPLPQDETVQPRFYLSCTGRYLVFCDDCRNGVIKICDTRAGTQLTVMRGARSCFSPDDRSFAFLDEGGKSIDVLDTGNWRKRFTATCKGTSRGFTTGGGVCLIRAMAFSPDGQTLALEDGPEIHLWHVGSGERLLVLRSHTHPVRALAFSADGRMMASKSAAADGSAGQLCLWDAQSFELQAAISLKNITVLQDGAAIGIPERWVSNPMCHDYLWFSTDGQRIAFHWPYVYEVADLLHLRTLDVEGSRRAGPPHWHLGTFWPTLSHDARWELYADHQEGMVQLRGEGQTYNLRPFDVSRNNHLLEERFFPDDRFLAIQLKCPPEDSSGAHGVLESLGLKSSPKSDSVLMLELWDVATRRRLTGFPGYRFISFDSRSKYMFTAREEGDGERIEIWDVPLRKGTLPLCGWSAMPMLLAGLCLVWLRRKWTPKNDST